MFIPVYLLYVMDTLTNFFLSAMRTLPWYIHQSSLTSNAVLIAAFKVSSSSHNVLCTNVLKFSALLLFSFRTEKQLGFGKDVSE